MLFAIGLSPCYLPLGGHGASRLKIEINSLRSKPLRQLLVEFMS